MTSKAAWAVVASLVFMGISSSSSTLAQQVPDAPRNASGASQAAGAPATGQVGDAPRSPDTTVQQPSQGPIIVRKLDTPSSPQKKGTDQVPDEPRSPPAGNSQ